MSNFSNRFALLDDDEAPAPQPKAAAPVSTPKNAATPNGVVSDKPARGRGAARGRGQARGGAQQADRAVASEGPVGDDPVRDDRASAPRGRGGRGGARGTRGRGAGRGGRNERPDRASATGREDSDKKEHQGWGGDEGKRELADEDEGARDARAEGTPADASASAAADEDWGALPSDAPGATPAAANGAATTSAPEPEAEPEDVSKTYEEYLAERASKVSVGGQLNVRKANEGADEAQWSKGVALGKKDVNEDTFFAGKQAAQRTQKKKEDKRQFIEIEPTFAPRESESRGGRGGRGRGGRGRSDGFRGNRGGRGAGRADFGRGALTQNQPNVTNEIDFPSL